MVLSLVHARTDRVNHVRPEPAGDTAEGWQSREGRAALQQRLQSVVADYRDADVSAAIERRRRERRRVAAAHGGEDEDEDDGADEPTDAQERAAAEGATLHPLTNASGPESHE